MPGRTANLKGFRNPYAMIRRAFASGLAASGLSGSAAPVDGSTRISVPSRVCGSPVVRMSWARSAPPSAVGGVSAVPAPVGGSPHGLVGLPACP